MDNTDLQRRVVELEVRLNRLEDIEAIRRLKCEHALASDDHPNLRARFMAIVTDDIELDYGPEFGRHVGRAKLNELLNDTPFSWTFHIMVPKRIDLADDGRSATGIWYMLEPAVAKDPQSGEPRAVWLGGVYTDTYRKQPDGRWLISRIQFDTKLMVPYDVGWSKAQIAPMSTPRIWTELA